MVNLQIKGYTPPSDIGYGTWDDITPSTGIMQVETERNIDGGDSARIVLLDDVDFAEFEQQRAIQIFLGGTSEPSDLIWEGFMLAPELGVHSPWVNLKTYEISCVGYEKFLMRKDVTKTWTDETFNTIFADLAAEANANMRFPTYKRFAYDTTKLTNYQAGTYNNAITRDVDCQKIFDTLKELVPVLDGMDITYAYEYGFYLDYMQSSLYIYLMPDMLYSDASAISDFSDASTIHSDSLRVTRNYDRLINYSHAIGDDYETVHYHAEPLSAVDIVPPSNDYDFYAAKAPSERSYVAIEIQNDAIGSESGSFSITGYLIPLGSEVEEDIYFSAPFSRTTTVYSKNRFVDFLGINAFTIRNMLGATINVYECTHGIAGKSIQEFGIASSAPRRLDLDTQDRVDNFAQQEVRLSHNPVHEATFRLKNHNTTNYINKTIDLTDPYLAAIKRYLVTKQRYIIPQNYDVEQWLTAIYRNYDWE